MMRSVINLLHVDFGIEAANVVSIPMTLRQRSYPQPADRLAFYERALARVEAIPGRRIGGDDGLVAAAGAVAESAADRRGRARESRPAPA